LTKIKLIPLCERIQKIVDEFGEIFFIHQMDSIPSTTSVYLDSKPLYTLDIDKRRISTYWHGWISDNEANWEYV